MKPQKPLDDTVPPILNSGVPGDALTRTITTAFGKHTGLVLPERTGYEDTIIQADMMAQLAKYGLTFADIKQGNRFEVRTEGWIPKQGAYDKGGKKLLKKGGSTLTFSINAQGSFVLEKHKLGGSEGTYFAGSLSSVYLGNQPQKVVDADGTFIPETQFDYINSQGRMGRFADHNATLRIVSMKKL